MNIKQQQLLFKKYLDGKATVEERLWVEQWYNAFDSLPTKEEIDVQTGELMLSSIQKKIRRERVIKLWSTVVSTAAVIVIAVFGGWYYSFHQDNLYADPYSYASTWKGELKQYTLPDSSTLILNENTVIKYIQEDFNKKSREIWLEAGEAYFDVAHKDSLPFIVHTDLLSTKVLGTAFSIKKADKHHDIQVSVVRGKVQVNASSKSLAFLTRGKQMNYNTFTAKHRVSEINPDLVTAWQKESITLKNASFQELSEVFYSLYNTRLVFEKEEIRKYRYTITLDKNTSDEKSLEIITAIHKLKFKKENDIIILY